MPNIKSVSFTDPYGMDVERIRRQQALAMQLQQQSGEDLPAGQMAGGYFVPTSPLSHLARALKGTMGRSEFERGDRELKALGERQRADFNADRSALTAAMQGRPAEPGVDDPTSGYSPPTPAQAPNPQAMQQLDFRSPMFRQAQMQQLVAQMQREQAEPQRVDLGDRIGLLKNGAIVGYIPKNATPDATLREPGSNLRHAQPSGSAQLGSQTTLQTHATPSGSTLASNAVAMRGQNLTDTRAQQTLAQGKTPPGFRSTPEGNLQAIPGGPADTKLQGVMNQDTAILSSSTSSMDRLATAANEALNHPGLAGTAGLRGAIPNIPGTSAADAAALLNTLKSQVAFGVLQDMRNNSKTGGALGNVSDAEGKRLEANLAALEKSQSVDQLRNSLKKIVDYTQSAKDRLREAFNMKHSGKADAPAYAGPERRAAGDDPLGLRKK